MYKIHYTKNFVTGNLKGLTFDSTSSFSCLQHAAEFMSFLSNHHSIPVNSLDSSNYTVSNIKMES